MVRQIQQQLRNQSQTSENLRAIYDARGRVVAYERMADPDQLRVLNRSTDLAKMTGAWRGRQIEEMLSESVNQELVDNLHEIWERDRRAGRANEYVNLARLGSNADPIIKEAAGLVPKQTWNYVRQKFGPDMFMVRRDMVLDSIGDRQASVGMFTGQTRWNPKVAEKFENIAFGIFVIKPTIT